MPRRGDSVAKATDLFTIHSSLFTKKLSLFHIGWYFEEVPTVNPSVKNQRFLPAPFGKGAIGVHRPKPPLLKGGASACRGGGIPRHRLGTSSLITLHYSLKTPFPFPHRFVLIGSANCESLSHASGVPAPFGNLRRASSLWQGSLWVRYRYRAG